MVADLRIGTAVISERDAERFSTIAFLRGGTRPPIHEVIQFIDEHKDWRSGTLRWGIESIAKTVGIAPSTYHAAKKRPPSARTIRDAELRPQILWVWEENLAVYGADKIWDQPEQGRGSCCPLHRRNG